VRVLREFVESLKTVNTAEIATLQCLESIYIWKALLTALSAWRCISVYWKALPQYCRNFLEIIYSVW